MIHWGECPLRKAHDDNNLDASVRQEVASKLTEADVEYVFTGHVNGIGKDQGLEIIQTSSLGKEKLGFRVVKVNPEGVLHKFFELDNSPIDLNSQL